MINKRYVIRKRKRIPVRFGVESPAKIAFTDDITLEGLFVRTATVLAPGSRLVVELNPPEGRILLLAEVRWAKRVPPQMLNRMKGGMGLKILAFQEGAAVYQQICALLYQTDHQP